jgi:glutamate synthase (NADPH/NADH) large chain
LRIHIVLSHTTAKSTRSKEIRNWMRAREALLASDLIPGEISRIFPIVDAQGSDTASFDEVLELSTWVAAHCLTQFLMMIPEAWENHATMTKQRRDFYAFHASMMEPWDGPACVTFTDGRQVGAVLDRNGLRPSRFWVTADGLVVLASEVGVLDIPAEKDNSQGASPARSHVPCRYRTGSNHRR